MNLSIISTEGALTEIPKVGEIYFVVHSSLEVSREIVVEVPIDTCSPVYMNHYSRYCALESAVNRGRAYPTRELAEKAAQSIEDGVKRGEKLQKFLVKLEAYGALESNIGEVVKEIVWGDL